MIVSKLLPAVSIVMGVLTDGVNRYHTVLPIGRPPHRNTCVGSPGSTVAVVVSIGGDGVRSVVTGGAAADSVTRDWRVFAVPGCVVSLLQATWLRVGRLFPV